MLASTDHLLDAFICAILARVVLQGISLPIPPNDRELARIEGWIHLPLRQPLRHVDGAAVLAEG